LAADAAAQTCAERHEPCGIRAPSSPRAPRGIRQSMSLWALRPCLALLGRTTLSTSTTTTVTLSRPPLPSAASTSWRAARSGFALATRKWRMP
jgi:hypothetical protein